MKDQVAKLFDIIDNNNWDDLVSIFHPSIVYERPGYDSINGIDQLLFFYKETRNIISGKHIYKSIIEEKNHIACWGRLLGINKQLETVDIEFMDIYYFTDNFIHFRKTFFYTKLI